MDQTYPVQNDGAAFLAAHPDLEAVEFLVSDTNGVLRGKWAPASALEKAFSSGINLPLSLFGLDAWGREVQETGLHIASGDADGFCIGVAGTVCPVPWAKNRTAQAILTMTCDDDRPFFGDPRNVLKSLSDRAADSGLTACAAFELEFFLLDPRKAGDGDTRIPPINASAGGPDRQHMYALSELSDIGEFLDALRAGAVAQAIPVDTIVSEAAPGQFEVNLNHCDDILRAADDAVLLRRLICETARNYGFRATFMAKPFGQWAGNGMHIHVSLLDGNDANIFADPKSGNARRGHAVAGLLDTMREATIIFVSTYNGFRRLQPDSYAPTRIAWGSNNRSVAVRIPPSPPSANRIEHRIAGADANPYLVGAAVLAGMLHGLEAADEPPAGIDGNAYDAEDVERLPDNMAEAIALFEASPFIGDYFGAPYRKLFSEIKKVEYQAFLSEITELERQTYL